MIPALLSIGFITLLLFLPLMCYWDIRDRKVPWEYFAVLAALNIPATAYLYYTGTLSLWHLAYSLAVCIFAFAVWKIYGAGAFSAADRNLVCCIALFFYWNPFSPAMDTNYVNFIATIYLVKFLVYLIVVLCILPGIIFAYNLIAKRHKKYFKVRYNQFNMMEEQQPYTAWEMVTRLPQGIPMILPIAAAFLMAAVWGI